MPPWTCVAVLALSVAASALPPQEPAGDMYGCQRVEGPSDRTGRQARSVDLPEAVVVDGDEDVDGVEVLDEQRLLLAVEAADDTLALGRTGHEACRQVG